MSMLKNAFSQSSKTKLKTKYSKRRDEYTTAMQNVSIEALNEAITQEFKVIDQNLDLADSTVDILGSVNHIQDPTDTEAKLFAIAQSLSAPTQDLDLTQPTPAMETATPGNFKLNVYAVEQRLQVAQESILSGVADIWTAFKAFLSKLTFNLRTYNSQINKLRSILHNVRGRATRDTIDVELKASPLMFAGVDESRTIKPLQSTQAIAEALKTYCTGYDAFSTSCANAIYVYSSRYMQTFTTLFNSQARSELFFTELNEFKESFFDAIIRDAKLDITERKGLVSLRRSPVSLCGSYFAVTSPSEVINSSTNIDAILRSFKEYAIEVETVDFNPQSQGKTRMITVGLNDIESMLTSLDDVLTMLDTLVNQQLLDNITNLEKFVDMTLPQAEYDQETGKQTLTSKIEQGLTAAQIAFKKTNAVARLQVMQAYVAIGAFQSINSGLVEKLDHVISFSYEALTKKEWYQQELGM